MKHIPYEKIRDDLSKYNFSIAQYRQVRKLKWVVTEKIHGANFCILTNGQQVKFAKRKALLKPSEDFFAYQTIQQELRDKAIAIFDLVKQQVPTIEYISLYGELFGGAYPHGNITPNPNFQPIQTGVYYSTNIEFSAFDLAYVTHKARHYLDFHTFSSFCKKADLLCVTPLLIGSYQAAQQFSPDFETKIPAILDMPSMSIIQKSNKAEGIVIKPVQDCWMQVNNKMVRPIFKVKHKAFKEDKRFHQAQKWTYAPPKTIIINEAFLQKEVYPLINKARLQSAISKVGKLKRSTRHEVEQEFIEDVYKSLEEFVGQLADWQKQQLKRPIEKACDRVMNAELK